MSLVRFYKQAVRNEAKSKEAGCAIFDTVVYCEKKNPGERDTAIYPVHKMDPPVHVQFPAAWAAYQRDESSEGLTGTPLREWTMISAGEAETFIHSGVRTVEELAALTDANVTKFPGGLALRQKAVAWLKAARDSAPLTALAAEVAEKDAMIAELQEQVAQLAKAQGVELDTKPRKRRKATGAEV